MVDNPESADNPYATPVAQGTRPGHSKAVRWVLLCIAIVLGLSSLPIAWQTFELANQEYFHIWNSQRAIYDIEVNGSPVSNDTAIVYGAALTLIQWSLAAVLIVVPPILAKRRAKKIQP